MYKTIVHHEGAGSLETAVGKVKLDGAVIKLGLDMHLKEYVTVAQYDQLLPKPARRFRPQRPRSRPPLPRPLPQQDEPEPLSQALSQQLLWQVWTGT